MSKQEEQKKKKPWYKRDSIRRPVSPGVWVCEQKDMWGYVRKLTPSNPSGKE